MHFANADVSASILQTPVDDQLACELPLTFAIAPEGGG
jgi:hypothetical protein